MTLAERARRRKSDPSVHAETRREPESGAEGFALGIGVFAVLAIFFAKPASGGSRRT